MRWRKTTQPLRLALVNLGHHDLVYGMSIGRKRLWATQLDALDDFDVLLATEVLHNIVHRMLKLTLTTWSRTRANDVTFTPPARGCCRKCTIANVWAAVGCFPGGRPALRSSGSPHRIVTGLARLPDCRARALVFLLCHRTFLHSDWVRRVCLAAPRRTRARE